VFISLFYMLRANLRVDICPLVQPHHLAKGVSVIDSSAPTVACGPHNGAGFLFISDLTNNATGATLIILLLLYVGSQLASSLVMQSPTMDKTQRQIMLFMPLIFVFIVIKFPAGVLVYWITTNTWTIVQQLVVKRRIGPPGAPPVAVAAGAAGRGGSGAVGANVNGPTPTPKPNGSDRSSLGGLGGLLRDRTKGSDASASTQTRDRTRTTPPPSPRKKKKRSGRRR
jgi:YidC/Oxa1 family membrane protein insertase